MGRKDVDGSRKKPVWIKVFIGSLVVVVLLFAALVFGVNLIGHNSETHLKSIRATTHFFSMMSLGLQVFLVVTVWWFWDGFLELMVKNEKKKEALKEQRNLLCGLSLAVLAVLAF